MARPRSGEKYDAIMQATLQIGAEAGFHGLSMSKIAKGAGVATATIYIYFENIDAIINQLYVDLKELVFGECMAGVKPYMSSQQSFELIWKNLYHNILNYNLEFRFLEQFTNSPYITQISREEGYRPFSHIIGFFQEGIKKGDIKNMPMDVIMAFFFAPIASITKNIIAGHLEMTEKQIQKAIENAWSAIKV
ncbi:MAG: TetR/AcrR family transcriptional regulator [Saprospiraceae bacterium]|nr:TetR/AcrR family transcriptional regulator [Saprospiraceae bacterium]